MILVFCFAIDEMSVFETSKPINLQKFGYSMLWVDSTTQMNHSIYFLAKVKLGLFKNSKSRKNHEVASLIVLVGLSAAATDSVCDSVIIVVSVDIQ